jgi:hypothetical protein
MFHNLRNNPRFWRYLTNLWAFAVFIAALFDFWKDNAYDAALGPLIAVYIGALAIYAGDKEFGRWHDSHNERHPGELYVIVWTVLIFGILITDLIFDKPYKMPGEIISAYIAVLSILAITKKSKSLYEVKEGVSAE